MQGACCSSWQCEALRQARPLSSALAEAPVVGVVPCRDCNVECLASVCHLYHEGTLHALSSLHSTDSRSSASLEAFQACGLCLDAHADPRASLIPERVS